VISSRGAAARDLVHVLGTGVLATTINLIANLSD
jgi:hypothetical protein